MPVLNKFVNYLKRFQIIFWLLITYISVCICSAYIFFIETLLQIISFYNYIMCIYNYSFFEYILGEIYKIKNKDCCLLQTFDLYLTIIIRYWRLIKQTISTYIWTRDNFEINYLKYWFVREVICLVFCIPLLYKIRDTIYLFIETPIYQVVYIYSF